MSAKLLALLNWTITVVTKLIQEGDFNAAQHVTLNHILDGVREMLAMLASLPDVREEHIRHELIYETRSLLTTVLGYAEILLDEDEGELIDPDRVIIAEIHDTGHQMLDELTGMLT